VSAIEAAGGIARAYRATVESLDEDQEMVATIAADLGPVDILVNNAGVASRGRAVVDTDPEEPARVIGVHAIGPHHLCALVLPAMRQRTRGDIVFVSSVSTRTFGANGAPYNMGKAAMEALAFTLSKEELAYGIRVNVVAPGLVETDMGRRLVKATLGVQDIARLHQSMPFGRVCQPDDVAAVVRFLVSEQGSYVSGQRIYVDGGGQLGQ
jgi:NAD(P)-dependent dehydrogenase (short-subunit alcohol dehydrogenase family)